MTPLFQATLGQWEYLLRIVISSVCGALIGLERSRRHKEAGIRTHIIVAMGAALTMIVSKYAFFDVIGYESINVDASRIAANVITGISFLGAGVIFSRSSGVRGLTTAAGIWATSAVGMAIGSGMYTVGILSTVMIYFVQMYVHKLMPRNEGVTGDLTVLLADDPGALSAFRKQMSAYQIYILGSSIHRNDDQTVTMQMTVRMAKDATVDDLLKLMDDNPQIKNIVM